MAFSKKTIRDIDVDGKRVLVRVDFNVPVADGVVGDTTRIKAAIPTIQYLVDHNAKVILMSHLGRPKGDGPEPALSLAPVAEKLAELSGLNVSFVADTYGEAAAEAAAALEPGHVLVLENVRFDKREKKNDPEIAKKLADLADIFVLDAFGTAHRAQGSVVGPAQYLPAVAGFLLEKEVSTLSGLFSEPKRPFVAILGGSKVSDKIGVIDRLLDSADTVIVGGGMAYTFAKAQGGKIGNSLCEDDWCDRALEMLDKAKKNGVNFLLPVDNVVADDFANDANTKIAKTGEIEDGWQGLDIGSGDRAALRRCHRGCQDRLLERPLRRVRDGHVRPWHQGDRRGYRSQPGLRLRDRRRRLRCCREQVRPGRQDDVHFYGRWRLDAARRGQAPAGSGGSQ